MIIAIGNKYNEIALYATQLADTFNVATLNLSDPPSVTTLLSFP